MTAREKADERKAEVMAEYFALPTAPALDVELVKVWVQGNDLTRTRITIKLEARQGRPGAALKTPPQAS